MARPYAPTDHVDNIVLGAGYIYFDRFDDNGNPTGERYLGQTPSLSISASSESLEHMTSDGPIAEVDASVVTSVTREGSLTIDDISIENLALFLAGDIDYEDGGDADLTDVTQEFVTATRGLYYQLGEGVGDFNIDDIDSVKSGDSNPVTLTADDDYEFHAATGRLYLKPGGDAKDGEKLTVEYSRNERIRTIVTTSDRVILRGALRFEADNSHGENFNLYISECDMAPDGSLEFKSRSDWQQIEFSLRISGKVQLYTHDEG